MLCHIRCFFLRRRTVRPLRLIVTWLGLCLLPAAHTQTPDGLLPATPTQAIPVPAAGNPADSVILNMAQAFRKKDSATLTALLPQARGHALEPWAAYWELSARLPTASPAEVDAFLRRYANTYQEDRLRNDWLLQLGQNSDWDTFARFYPAFRMRDDHAVRCYAIMAAQPLGLSPEETTLMLQEAWFSRNSGGSACNQAAGRLHAQNLLTETDIWRRARQSIERRQLGSARAAVAILDAVAADLVQALFENPQRHLETADLSTATGRELAVLATARQAILDPAMAAQWLQVQGRALSAGQRDWLWGSIGRQAALNLDLQATGYFSRAGSLRHFDEEHLEWMARNALRHGQWAQVRQAIEAMNTVTRQQPAWTYWLVRSLQDGRQRPAQRSRKAETLLQQIAGHQGFYELLALEELRGRIDAAQPVRNPDAQELAAARANPGLQRALHARSLGLNSEATREWNYSTNLHQRGGMNDRDLLASAALACQQQWWDRCINTSERTRQHLHMQQRFPLPYRESILAWSQRSGLDPDWVFGLIRQESRFAPQARSGAGASGLMQVMPGTARLVARKLGLAAPASGSIDGNLQLGTSYLAQLHSEFGSAAMASAAYNAGPGRPRRWREGPEMEGAIWAENIPFAETRDYVKQVLANSVNYALLRHDGQAQSLYTRLGVVRPTLAAQQPLSSDPNPEPAGDTQ